MSHPFVGIGSNNHMMMFLADFECGAFISQGWAILEPECYKSRAPAAQKNRAALTRRPYFLSAFSLFAARCLPASPSCCFTAGKPFKALTSKA